LIAGAARRPRCQLDKQTLFPDVCAKAKNGFAAWQICFVVTCRTTQSSKPLIISDYYRTSLRIHATRPPSLHDLQSGHWPIAAINFGAEVTIGVPQ
jgi:hypothetical protein